MWKIIQYSATSIDKHVGGNVVFERIGKLVNLRQVRIDKTEIFPLPFQIGE